jgi:hypothetical protein
MSLAFWHTGCHYRKGEEFYDYKHLYGAAL